MKCIYQGSQTVHMIANYYWMLNRDDVYKRKFGIRSTERKENDKLSLCKGDNI